MNLVEVADLPKLEDIVEAPEDDLLRLYKTCLEMQEVCDREHGIGLSAIQVGLPWKLFIVKVGKDSQFASAGEYGYFLNCEYKAATEGRVVSLEGCLSLRSPEGRLRHFQVERYADIELSGKWLYTIDNQLYVKCVNCVLGLKEQSVVFQHEIDHHRAVLISEIGKEIFIWR